MAVAGRAAGHMRRHTARVIRDAAVPGMAAALDAHLGEH